MSIIRSYFTKDNTIIKNNYLNSSLNPIMEISYGRDIQSVSRYIFDIDLDNLKNKVNNNEININNIKSHTLKLTNTIAYFPEYTGKKRDNDTILRASGVKLDIFNINESWDEGVGYDFIYEPISNLLYPTGATNWFKRTNSLISWSQPGAFISGSTILGSQYFTQGSENLSIDVTDYINGRIFSGTTGFTGTTYGLGIKLSNEYEILKTKLRNAIAFFAKNTNTYYEPFIETVIDDNIIDDRNYFYLNKNNNLYLYSNINNQPSNNIIVNNVKIYDYNDQLYLILSGNSITNISNGIYGININIDSDLYPDAVIFKDVWNVTINNKTKDIEQEFYLISDENYYNLNNNVNNFNPENYYFNFLGIEDNETIKAGEVKNIKLLIKQLYDNRLNQNNFIPLDIEYRIFTTAGTNYEIDVIPFTKINRLINNYQFNIDTSWLIPQDYFIQLRLVNNNIYYNNKTIRFTVVNNNIKI